MMLTSADLGTGGTDGTTRNLDVKSTFRILLSSQSRVVVRFSSGLPVTHGFSDGLEDAVVQEMTGSEVRVGGDCKHTQRCGPASVPLDHVLLLLDGLSQRISQSHLSKVLQGGVDGVTDGVVEDALHSTHENLQPFDHGDHLTTHTETQVRRLEEVQ